MYSFCISFFYSACFSSQFCKDLVYIYKPHGFPGASDAKESTCNVGDQGSMVQMGSIPGSGKSPGEGNGNPLQYSCLEDPMDRGAWQAAIHGVSKSQTRLSN